MTMHTYSLSSPEYPKTLLHMHQPPAELFVTGDTLVELMHKPRVAIVGSRQITPYGRQVTTQLARQLVEQGVVVVSGLAYGVDACAHAAVVKAGGRAIAVLPTPLDAIYPIRNRELAQSIVKGGGVLVSSYAPGSESHKGNFVARNEIVAALSQAVVITEAAHKSGSLHTANFAHNLSVDVLAVPGNITSPTSGGTNQLIKTGATPVTCVADVLRAINLEPIVKSLAVRGETPEQQAILDQIGKGIHDGAMLQQQTGLEASLFNQNLTMLEISGAIMALGGNQWGMA